MFLLLLKTTCLIKREETQIKSHGPCWFLYFMIIFYEIIPIEKKDVWKELIVWEKGLVFTPRSEHLKEDSRQRWVIK